MIYGLFVLLRLDTICLGAHIRLKAGIKLYISRRLISSSEKFNLFVKYETRTTGLKFFNLYLFTYMYELP